MIGEAVVINTNRLLLSIFHSNLTHIGNFWNYWNFSWMLIYSSVAYFTIIVLGLLLLRLFTTHQEIEEWSLCFGFDGGNGHLFLMLVIKWDIRNGIYWFDWICSFRRMYGFSFIIKINWLFKILSVAIMKWWLLFLHYLFSSNKLW